MRDVMRAIVVGVCLLLASVAGHAQGDHMKVLGLPITGNITDFSAKLKAKGDTLVGNADGPSKMFKGRFAGEDCHVFALYDEKTKVVSEVQFKWARLYFDKGELDDLKAHLVSLLDKKYPHANKTQDSQHLPLSTHTSCTTEQLWSRWKKATTFMYTTAAGLDTTCG